MSEKAKTTVYLDRGEYHELKVIARSEGTTPAALIREAVSEYAARHRKAREPRSIAVGRSGRGDLSERVDELLAGMGRSG